MSETRELIITLPGNRRVDAHFGNHVVRTDQPVDNGGEDSAPSPFQLFLASIGTCAGIFVQGFCAKRNIDSSGVRIVERPIYDEQGTLKDVSLEVELPAAFPEKYREPLLRVIEQCSVKEAIAAQPTFTVRTVISGSPALLSEPAPATSSSVTGAF
jgi:putative redox protein